MKKRRFTSLSDDLEITTDNIQVIGEKIAVSAIKHAKRFAYGDLDKLYQELVHDINTDISIKTTFSNGYDIIQEAICYLCNFMGHKLGEICIPNIHKKLDCIRLACFKHIYHYLREERKLINKLDTDELKDMFVFEEDKEEFEDYSNYNKIISKLDLNKDDEMLLEYLSNDMSRPQIAEILRISEKTVTNRKKKIREKYLKIFK